MINSRKIADLEPGVAILCRAFVNKCLEEGIDIIITSTYRDYESQNALYAQGRTVHGRKVTGAKGGESYHNFRLAFDFAPIKNGKINWKDEELFRKCGVIAESVGLEWAGRWMKNNELAHCQHTFGKTLEQLREREKTV